MPVRRPRSYICAWAPARAERGADAARRRASPGCSDTGRRRWRRRRSRHALSQSRCHVCGSACASNASFYSIIHAPQLVGGIDRLPNLLRESQVHQSSSAKARMHPSACPGFRDHGLASCSGSRCPPLASYSGLVASVSLGPPTDSACPASKSSSASSVRAGERGGPARLPPTLPLGSAAPTVSFLFHCIME